MRFTTFAATLASVASIVAASPLALQARQEAARFGLVSVTPSDFVGGDDITIVYNASTATHQPEFVDFYIQGTFTDTSNRTPFFLIQRNDFAADQQILTLNEHVPDALNNLGAGNWVLTAFVTFEQDGLTEVGGISA
ncbi:hypothetical protein K435DRAFT_797652 [Dendrothele bispora CBS 962.96]|uniref:Uncharacterized protein n=1 Tax=Dendrothele bispora (strain CBS 962.96) TaxID=1314807 RepID=A0A4S8M1T9_DENBC|nr:hypothetical protein K435DRAFT_797652 [Dendrothele bispora CBS 962.96]